MTKRTADSILETIVDLYAKEQPVTRETLANVTGLKMSVIDDRLKYLHENGSIIRIQRGMYKPATSHPPARIVTRTILPDGTNSIEIGDSVLTLTPRETRMLGELFSSEGQQFAAIQLGHQVENLTGDLAFQLKNMRSEISCLRESITPTSEAERKRAYRHKKRMSQISGTLHSVSQNKNQDESTV